MTLPTIVVDMAEEASKPEYGVGESVWYCGQMEATVSSVEEADDEGRGHYYRLSMDGEEVTAHSDELEYRQTRINEQFRDEFGGLRVAVRSDTLGGGAHVNYSIPAQGAGDQLSPEEAREVAQAFRDGATGLAHIIDDDPEAVAEAFEEAADRIEEFNHRLETPPEQRSDDA